MASSSQPLPSTRRIVTGHDKSAKAVITSDTVIHGVATDHGPWIQSIWSTDSLPPDVNSPEDKGLVKIGLSNKGTVVRVLDFPPKSKGMLHRSITLDYIYVIKGTVTLVVDDEARTVVQENDMVVQQATMHSWDNETDEWARFLVVLIASEPPVVDGVSLAAEVDFHVE